MTTTSGESRGRLAYTAYCRKVNFLDSHGDPMPTFSNLDPAVRDAWIAAAQVIWDLATTGHAKI